MDEHEVDIIARAQRSGRDGMAEHLRYVTERDTRAALERWHTLFPNTRWISLDEAKRRWPTP